MRRLGRCFERERRSRPDCCEIQSDAMPASLSTLHCATMASAAKALEGADLARPKNFGARHSASTQQTCARSAGQKRAEEGRSGKRAGGRLSLSAVPRLASDESGSNQEPPLGRIQPQAEAEADSGPSRDSHSRSCTVEIRDDQ